MRLGYFGEEDWSEVVCIEDHVDFINLLLKAFSCLEVSVPISVIVLTGGGSGVVFSVSCPALLSELPIYVVLKWETSNFTGQ